MELVMFAIGFKGVSALVLAVFAGGVYVGYKYFEKFKADLKNKL